MGLKVETLARVAERNGGSGFVPGANDRKVFDTQADALAALHAQSMKGAGKVMRRITDDNYGLRSASDGAVFAIPLKDNGVPITDSEYWAE